MLTRLANFILYGNYFLAFCIVALCAETSVKNGFPFLDASFYLLVFLSTIVYYTHAYIGDNQQLQTSNPRSLWYRRNRQTIFLTQIIFTIIIVLVVIRLLIKYSLPLMQLGVAGWLLLLLFPFLALLYYGVIFPARFRLRLRNIAWLKPFIIGFVCTGFVTIYPLCFHALHSNSSFHVTVSQISYFITNWLFTSAISIMFDIKDFAADHNVKLQTFVVTKGLRYTISLILFPLAVGSFISFFLFGIERHFTIVQYGINAVPFVLLMYAATSLRRRKHILYYLFVIDGLLLVKGCCGIAAMLLVK